MAMKLMVCTMQRQPPNPCSCGNSGGLDVAEKLEQCINENRLAMSLKRVACFGICLKGPNVQLLPEGKYWHQVGLESVDAIIDYVMQSDKP